MISRRSFLLRSACVLAAPAIVRVGSLMPVKVIAEDRIPVMLSEVSIIIPPDLEPYARALLDSFRQTQEQARVRVFERVFA